METGHCVFETTERKVVHSILKVHTFKNIFGKILTEFTPNRLFQIGVFEGMKMTPPDLGKSVFGKKGGVKTTKVNDYKTSVRRVLKGNHRKPNHQWCSTECFRGQRSRAFE
jgi:hypothetical protein